MVKILCENIENDIETQSYPDPGTSGQRKNSILDLFKVNILELPDGSFTEGISELSSSGDSIQRYRASLDYLECDIFDTIKIVKFQNNIKNIFFKYYEFSKLKIDKVKKLIDILYSFYGVDDGNKGKFTDTDLKYYKSKKFYMFFGRRWIGDKFKYPVAVEIDRAADVIVLSIWGIESK